MSYLFSHKHSIIRNSKSYYYSKLTVSGQFAHLMDGINSYIGDSIHEPALWGLKHKELIKHRLSLGYIPIQDIIEEFKFSSHQ